MSSSNTLNYQTAGVNIDEGNRLVKLIKPLAEKTKTPGVMAGIGGFGALFELPWHDYKNPVLVSSTDGVGTKLKLAQQLNQHKTIGIDLVAMCVNDIITSGAKPLFFLDYFATSQLVAEQAADVIAGIAEGCLQSGCALVGGETAEMPGMYQAGEYDLAGFTVGLVEKEAILQPNHVKPSDVLIGLASSGPHSNGYSLIRKVIEYTNADLNQPFDNSTLAETLLAPTRIYVKTVLHLLGKFPIHAIAHITGGGILENLPRVLPEHIIPKIDYESWPQPEIFTWLQQMGQIESREMYRTFNCGIGLILVVDSSCVDALLKELTLLNEKAYVIGTTISA
jgi:phosphoribosylformylglycinamidine cyclo-ligase